MNLQKTIETKLLPFIQNPSKYIGCEKNSAVKDKAKTNASIVLCFPDTYEIGMSHLGTRILYDIINRLNFTCERAFSPWEDAAKIMTEENIPLFSLETKSDVKDFDMLGFSIQHELCYTNILNMLKLAHVPFRTIDRLKDTYPLIIAGGPIAYGAEPVAEFIDAFVIGDAEEALPKLMGFYAENKNLPKEELLLKIASEVEGIYVPFAYTENRDENGETTGLVPKNANIPSRVKKQIYDIAKKENCIKKWLVPFAETVHDRVILEIMRGCSQGCRFCQAGMIYRPVREKPLGNAKAEAISLLCQTGYDDISLASLSSTDYSQITNLMTYLDKETSEKKISLSLPSMRADNLDPALLDIISRTKKTGITIAAEAGSQRLRDYINKKITREDILNAADMAYKNGWNLVKLYFMIGLPTETYEDLDETIELLQEITRLKKGGKGNINATFSFFVPKAHTPFQWDKAISLEEMYNRKEYIYSKIKYRYIKLKFHNYKASFLESTFAKGDRSLSKVVETAFNKGCKFDHWKEFFNFNAWNESFAENGLSIEQYLNRYTDTEKPLPWDHIDTGITKEFFKRELDNAKALKHTADCRKLCAACGLKCTSAKLS